MLTTENFARWLVAYGAAWRSGDPQAAAALFAPRANYYWTPFEPPKADRAEIAAAWAEATSTQQDIEFRYTIWSVAGDRGIAHWHTRFTRIATASPVELDGVLLAEFDPSGLCTLFREWWHSNETGEKWTKTSIR